MNSSNNDDQQPPTTQPPSSSAVSYDYNEQYSIDEVIGGNGRVSGVVAPPPPLPTHMVTSKADEEPLPTDQPSDVESQSNLKG